MLEELRSRRDVSRRQSKYFQKEAIVMTDRQRQKYFMTDKFQRKVPRQN